MRKYGLDEGQLYVEQSTLLEPNNFIPSWEAGDEEKKEVSLALKKLRKNYDFSLWILLGLSHCVLPLDSVCPIVIRNLRHLDVRL